MLIGVSEAHLGEIARLHLDRRAGTPYWIARDRAFGHDAAPDGPLAWADFAARLGFRDLADQRAFERATRTRPIEEFVPAARLAAGERLWAAQTGGTTGLPKHGTWGAAYWRDTLDFSDMMMDLHGVPRGVNWLFLGPMGPHTTGRLIIDFAERRGGRCFSVDLDPRIVKIFQGEGMADAARRYVRHIFDQAAPILRHQRIGVLFCTSRLLDLIGEHLDPGLFQNVRAVLHAGTTMTWDAFQALRAGLFEGRPLVGIYGTSTTAISFQKPDPDEDQAIVYVPSEPHVRLDPVDGSGQPVHAGQEGRMATWRLTGDALIPGFWERDLAVRTPAYGRWAARFPWDWVADPHSPEFTVEGRPEGVY